MNVSNRKPSDLQATLSSRAKSSMEYNNFSGALLGFAFHLWLSKSPFSQTKLNKNSSNFWALIHFLPSSAPALPSLLLSHQTSHSIHPLQVPPLNAGKALSHWVRYKCAEDFLSPIFTPRAGEKGEKMRSSRKKTLGTGKTHPSRDLTLWSLCSSLTTWWKEMGGPRGLFLYLLNGWIRFQKLGVHSKYAKFAWHRYYNNNKLLVTSTINLNTLTKWQMSFL